MALYYVFVILIGIVYLAVLELSKNMIVGWIVTILSVVAMLVYRSVFYKGGAKNIVIAFAIFVLILVVNLFLTKPPIKRVPAVDNRKPDVTQIIEIPQGKLTGVYNKNHTAKVYAGIPYAKPPVGDLRFKEPQKDDGWEGVRKCDHFGPMAMQKRGATLVDSLSHILGWHDYRVKLGDEYLEEISEDCLYLNIFTPAENSGKYSIEADAEKLADAAEPSGSEKELLPVIFYIHGGYLTTGQSSYSEYRGEDLAAKGVVFVNFAYRLGVFGYYAADDLKAMSPYASTGNYGLLDQIAALQWVYDNIEAFGGDKNRITIAGESAGSSSVNAFCVSPLTEGLFQYAIAESSGILVKKPFHTFRSYEDAIKAGNEVRNEFAVSSSEELRKIPAKKLVETKTVHSSMTIDGYAITEQPYLTYEKGHNHEKALLNGFNAKESDAFILGTKATMENYQSIIENDMPGFGEKIAEIVPPTLPPRDQHFVVDALGDAKGALNVAYSAMWFSYSHYVWNNYMVAQKKPSYEYYFTKMNKSLSNYHAGEIPYAYGNLWRHPGLYDKKDYELSQIMQSYWVHFAYSGNPNGFVLNNDGSESEKTLPTWQMRDKNQDKLLELGEEIQMIDDPNQKIYELLDAFMDSVQ